MFKRDLEKMIGTTVTVFKGRKVPIGTVGFLGAVYDPYCRCRARYNYRATCYCDPRVEIITGDGDSHFTYSGNLMFTTDKIPA